MTQALRSLTTVQQCPINNRLHEVEILQKRIATAINARYVGRTLDVLVEGTARGRWYGRTRTNKLVHFASDEPLAGELVDVEVTGSEPWYLEGRVRAPELTLV